MFDVGFSEIALILVMGLIVLGPEKLPIAIRTVARWIKALRELSSGVQHTLAQELKINELQGEIQKLGESARSALKIESAEAMQTEINDLKLTLAKLQMQLNATPTSVTPNIDSPMSPDVSEINEKQSEGMPEINYIHGVPIVIDEDEADEDLEHYADETDPIFLKHNRHPPRDAFFDNSEPSISPALETNLNSTQNEKASMALNDSTSTSDKTS